MISTAKGFYSAQKHIWHQLKDIIISYDGNTHTLTEMPKVGMGTMVN
jgi:hypothetical protein